MPALVRHSELPSRTVPLVTTVHAAHGTTDRLGKAMLSTVNMTVVNTSVTVRNNVSSISVVVRSTVANGRTIRPTSRLPSRCR